MFVVLTYTGDFIVYCVRALRDALYKNKRNEQGATRNDVIVWKHPPFDTDHRPAFKTKTGTEFSGEKTGKP